MDTYTNYKICKIICKRLQCRYPRSWLILLTFCILISIMILLYQILYSETEVIKIKKRQIYHWLAHRHEYQQLVQSLRLPTIMPSKPICPEEPLLLITVCSSLTNFDQRKSIRETWGKDVAKYENVKVFFFVGKTNATTDHEKEIMEESENYSDLVQYDFVDSYYNLTIKSVLMLKWAIQFCPNSTYFMKVDDDMFLHIQNIVEYLNESKQPDLMIGTLLSKSKPFKNANHRWFVPDEEYAGSFYPNYLAGGCYILANSALLKLYKKASQIPFVRMEDFYITGLCAQASGLKPQDHKGFLTYKIGNDICFFRLMFALHTTSLSEMYFIWNQVFDSNYICP